MKTMSSRHLGLLSLQCSATVYMASKKKIKRYDMQWSSKKSAKRFYQDQHSFKKGKNIFIRSYNSGREVGISEAS